MANADVFVYLDSVPFSKGSYQNRTRIKSPRGPEWLTVPVRTAGRLAQPTREVEIDKRAPWGQKHRARLLEAYGGTPGWKEVDAALSTHLVSDWARLSEMAIALNAALRDLLGVTTPVVLASELGVEGSASTLLARICHAVGADTYLSGQGGHLYMEAEPFRALGVELRFQEFAHPVYAQPHGPFAAGLSAVDALASDPPAARAAVSRAA